MLPWEAKERTLNAPADDVLPLLELLGHESEVAHDTSELGPDDFYEDEYDPTCSLCFRG